MLRSMPRLALACLLLFGLSNLAVADPAIERGDYLVNTILACGNCHSPREANGEIIKDRALSGGRVFATPAFVVTTSNITPDIETGIGSWSDAEIKRALVEGIRPEHHRMPGVPLAAIMPANFYKALLPEDLDAIVAYLRSVKPVHNEISDPVYKPPSIAIPIPTRKTDLTRPRSPILSSAVPISSPSVTAWNVIPNGHGAYPTTKAGLAAAAGSFRREARPPTSPPTAPPASEDGRITKSRVPSPMASPATVTCSSRRWRLVIMQG
jgi:hypothetical protein